MNEKFVWLYKVFHNNRWKFEVFETGLKNKVFANFMVNHKNHTFGIQKLWR